MEGVWSDNARTSVVDITLFGKKVRNADKKKIVPKPWPCLNTNCF